MILIGKTRHAIVGLWLQIGARQAVGVDHVEQRQAPAMDQIVDQRGDEDGLASPGEARHTEPHMGIEQPGGTAGRCIKGNQGFIAQRGQLVQMSRAPASRISAPLPYRCLRRAVEGNSGPRSRCGGRQISLQSPGELFDVGNRPVERDDRKTGGAKSHLEIIDQRLVAA